MVGGFSFVFYPPFFRLSKPQTRANSSYAIHYFPPHIALFIQLVYLRKKGYLGSEIILPMMAQKPLIDKVSILFCLLAAVLITNTLLAEILGVKIFALEESLGLEPFNWNLFGQKGSLNFTAGVLLWPFVFILTDIINEYFGQRGVRFLSLLAVGMISYAFVMVFAAIALAPAEFWLSTGSKFGVDNMQAAFASIFGQGMWIIVASIIAFLIGQLIDALVFRRIKKWTGNKKVWLRANGSTAVSQFLDSYLVLYIAFVLGPQQWPIMLFLAIGTVNYIYKFVAAILLTPLIYLIHHLIDLHFLGPSLAAELKARAME